MGYYNKVLDCLVNCDSFISSIEVEVMVPFIFPLIYSFLLKGQDTVQLPISHFSREMATRSSRLRSSRRRYSMNYAMKDGGLVDRIS